ncbi:unnamed protein product [Dibothriocephalus latus]|uniref:Uncharacterized protein n=1 Tax=Dibothriocephalus latus TaxID=60516 RepID=A0A3P7P0N6_DIBLA|nr:unnamed protein product [Dibothriocephalus latus]
MSPNYIDIVASSAVQMRRNRTIPISSPSRQNCKTAFTIYCLVG